MFKMKKILVIAALLTMQVTQRLAAQDFDFCEMRYSPAATTFSLFAPADAKTVKVRIYENGLGGRALKTVRMKCLPGAELSGKGVTTKARKTLGAVWTVTVKGDLQGRYYTFDTGHGETPGVFAKAVGVNGRRGAIIDLRDTDPDGWHDDQRPVTRQWADLMVYELHHRDFSVARPDAQYPGKFLALTEPWAISHLTALGINAVHILPSYDFASIDETKVPKIASPASSPSPAASPSSASSPSPASVGCAAAVPQPPYNWGYDPLNYNTPEGSYATDPYTPATRIREFKQMVQALHRVGIRVILDVVYNHTFDIEHSNFQLTFPDYYYRTIDHSAAASDGAAKKGSTSKVQYSNGSGCGNETASEQPMMRRFMIESVKYWLNEYHIDGFRFDLMGCHDIETMNAIRQAVDEIDPTIFIYGEGWSAGPCALPNEQLAMKANISQTPGIAAFSDDLRDALRGPFSDDTKPGWLGAELLAASEPTAMASLQESIKAGIAGMIQHPQVDYSKVNYSDKPYALEPTQMMSYVSCHDDMCLVDRLIASVVGKDSPDTKLSALTPGQLQELIRLDLLAQTAVFTSQGVPFMLSGEELLRTKQGVHNSFESPDSINQLDWRNMQRYPQVFKYYQGLTQLRRHHPAFRLGNADLVRKHLEFLDAPAGVVAYRLRNYAGRDPWRNIIVILNANRETATVSVPEATYTVVCKEGEIDEQSMSKISGHSVTVSPQSALILHD